MDDTNNSEASVWDGYKCCQGFSPCCNDCLDALVCCTGDARCCCMCVECLLCPGLAISASRVQLMIAGALQPDPADFQIIRFNNCMQMLACICHIAAIFNRNLRSLAHLVEVFSHVVFMCTAGCMAAQIHHEVKHLRSALNEPLRQV